MEVLSRRLYFCVLFLSCPSLCVVYILLVVLRGGWGHSFFVGSGEFESDIARRGLIGMRPFENKKTSRD